MAQVVDDATTGEAAVPLELRHRRHDVGDRQVADLHQVEWTPDAGHEVGESLVDPQRHRVPNHRARDDVELEDVGQLVRDQPIEAVRRLVDRQGDAVAVWFRERADPLRTAAGKDVLLLELAVRLEDDQRGTLNARSWRRSALSCW